MERSVAPVNVSPFIKAVRWTFLILGIFYGANRWRSLRAYEDKAAPKRKQELLANYQKLKANERLLAKEDLEPIGKDFGITEFPPGWEDEL